MNNSSHISPVAAAPSYISQAHNVEHDEGLRFCWHLRVGHCREIDAGHLRAYADCFYTDFLSQHLLFEEQFIFPLQGACKLVKKALSDHRKLRRLFEDRKNPARSLNLVEEWLESHIRFEEPVLIPAIRKTISGAEFEHMLPADKGHEKSLRAFNTWPDRFWELE